MTDKATNKGYADWSGADPDKQLIEAGIKGHIEGVSGGFLWSEAPLPYKDNHSFWAEACIGIREGGSLSDAAREYLQDALRWCEAQEKEQ